MFMLHLLKQAVNPKLGLAECIAGWDNISFYLREPPRKRALQRLIPQTERSIANNA